MIEVDKCSSHFQPGETRSVVLIRISGKQVIRGGNAIADCPVDDSNVMTVMGSLSEGVFGHLEEPNARSGSIITLSFSSQNFPENFGLLD